MKARRKRNLGGERFRTKSLKKQHTWRTRPRKNTKLGEGGGDKHPNRKACSINTQGVKNATPSEGGAVGEDYRGRIRRIASSQPGQNWREKRWKEGGVRKIGGLFLVE